MSFLEWTRGTSAMLLLGAAGWMMGCGSKPPPVAGPEAALDTSQARATCPFGIANAHVQFDETATGATILVTTTPDRLDELRRRARDAAQMHGSGKHTGEGHAGAHGEGRGQHGLQPVHLPPTRAVLEEVADGARITFTPEKQEDVDVLRGKLRARVERMMSRCD